MWDAAKPYVQEDKQFNKWKKGSSDFSSRPHPANCLTCEKEASKKLSQVWWAYLLSQHWEGRVWQFYEFEANVS